VDPDPDPDSGGKKRPTKEEKLKIFHVLECWMLRSEGFFCNLDVLYGGLGMSKL
jgi:hypothetical protein